MCGLCGIAVPRELNRGVERSVIERMRDSLFHRGRDDAGVFMAGRVGLGHRRLSIVDLSGGHQPMPNEDGTVWIAYNGEVYNHRGLRDEMQQRGHQYRTESDTETIIHLYEEYGARAVERLRGMFAFAIWDSGRDRLVLARDRLGIKPLYYTLSDNGVISFASEIKALIEAGAVRPELNYDALADYAANRCTSSDQTLFRGVKRLPPGHTLTWSDGRIEIERYWDVSFAKPAERIKEDEYVEQFAELFDEAVRLRLMADVPLGMFLSGGIDSSAIAAAMSTMVDEPIKTFSVGFAEREANELRYARMISRMYGTDHHEVVVTPEQFFDALPALVYQEDEPIAHASSVPLYFVSKLASGHVKVVLTGEGSDELLAGYGRYTRTVYNLALGRVYRRAVAGGLRGWVKKRVESLGPTSEVARKLSRTFLCIEPEIEDIYFDNYSVFSKEKQRRLFTAETRERMAATDPYETALAELGACDSEDLLDRLLAADLKTYLHELLMKQDQMSMAASIESRVPFLDHKLVEFAARLPVGMKLHGLKTKYILRRAMRGRLPEQILTRKKMGFPVPLGSWLREKFRWVVEEYVLSERARAHSIFNHEYVRELAARHAAGEDHSERLWSLINFEIWQRRFIDGEAAGPPAERAIDAVEVALSGA